MLTSALALILAIGFVAASPTARESHTVIALSATELAAFAPYTQFARAAYCSTFKLSGWRCGEACDAIPDFQPTLVGGDGNFVQFYFVGYWPAQNSVVVAHQGTDPTQLVSILTDLIIPQSPLDPSLFPGVSPSVLVHSGFRNEHALTAPKILAEVKSLMASKNTTSVTLIGHSLGGALAELDAVYLSLNLPAGTTFRGRTFGTPRVGNIDFANLLDSRIPNYKRINNKKDIVPIVPGRRLNFSHSQGEVHILGAGNAVACSGQDDAEDAQCQIRTVPTVFDGHILDHLGPYEGIPIGTLFCT